MEQSLNYLTFGEFVEYARIATAPPHWHIPFEGVNITHENDSCYLIPTNNGVLRFTPDFILVKGDNGLYLTEK